MGTPMARHITTVHLPKIQKAHSYGQAHYNTTSSQNTKSPLLWPGTLQQYIFPKYKKPTPMARHITTLQQYIFPKYKKPTPMARHIKTVHLPKIQKAHSYGQAHYNITAVHLPKIQKAHSYGPAHKNS